MRITRRDVLKAFAGAVPALRGTARAQADSPQIASGTFKPTRESLAAYRVPEWFRDAKFGIWAHWGPQSAPEAGDWYARRMYIPGEPQYKYHLEHFGHPSKFGFKDVIQTWKGEKFDPDYLVGLYKQAGAKYFVSMGVHHDNFDLWDSTHTRWNAVKMGPRRDIVGSFRKAALKHGLRFGVSDHLWITYKWFSVSRGSDSTGQYAGVPYDGADPRFSDLYGDCKKIYKDLPWTEEGIPETWKQHWFLRIKDLIDKYHPDYLYSDGALPFQQWGLSLLAHFYNQNASRHAGRVEAVYTSKREQDCEVGTCALDFERGLPDRIWPSPWQTDTCIGDWHYNKNIKYKSPKRIIDMLVDVVSRNGNLLLNFPLPGSGMLDEEELKILAEITKWLSVNGDAIYSTRPWKTFGEGPGMKAPPGQAQFNEGQRKDLTAEDIRFTAKGNDLFAFAMGWPGNRCTIPALAANGKHQPGRISRVRLLGFGGNLQWKQDDAGLRIELPNEKPCDYAIVFRITRR